MQAYLLKGEFDETCKGGAKQLASCNLNLVAHSYFMNAFLKKTVTTSSTSDNSHIPYGRQTIDEDDIQAVIDVLRSDYLTTGPKVDEFEAAVCQYTGAEYGVAVSSGTAALHSAMYALDIGPGDEVIVPPITFAATANCIVYQGGTPVFADIDPDTLLLDPVEVEKKITRRTKAVIAVDYAGQPCDYDRLSGICNTHGLKLVADACHSLGAQYKGRNVGSLADMTVLSFHPVKHITTGEGGMVVTDDPEIADKIRMFRNHGIHRDPALFTNPPIHASAHTPPDWYYEMIDLGYNYRITDIQCALGISQLKKLPLWIKKRQEIAAHYDESFNDQNAIKPLKVKNNILHAYHLYVIKLLKKNRDTVFNEMGKAGIGVNVHYIPVHLHPFYRKHSGTGYGLCPRAESVYNQIMSLPIYPDLTSENQNKVLTVLKEITE